MSFGDNLQHQSSHRALLHLQDAEIQLLESMRKCIDQRIKSDRQYASALAVLVSHAQKFDSGISSPLFQAWNNIVKETQNWILLLRDHADKLSAKALETLCNIITEKKAARKFYLDEKLRLEAGLRKVKDEVTKHKQDYEKNITKHIQDRLKLEEFMAKGLPAKKLEDARMKLTKSSMKLHKTHNNYVAALLEASEHERHYLGTVLPNLLNYQEEIEKLMVLQCKSVLKDYADLTDFSTPEHTAIYKRIHEQADSISPATEYKTFIEKHKTEKLQSSKLEFDSHLLTGYHGTLKENELAVDSFTLENVQQSFSKVTEQLQECQQSILSKASSLASEQEQLNNISGQEQSNKYIVSKRTVLRLERELNELRCREKVLTELKELYNRQLTKLGGRTPPLGVDLLETTSVPTSNYEGADSAVDGTRGQSKLNVVLHKLKKPSPVPPPPPEKDFIPDATNGNDGARISNSSSQHPPVSVMRQAHGPACDSYQQIAVGDDSRPLPQMVSNTGRRLDDEEWFHGVLPREEVQRLLVNDGDYLVRVSKNRKTGEMQYVLSVMWNDHKHFIIQGQEGAWRFEADQYPTIQELIINQHNSGVPVTRKSGAILKNPVLRETWELKNDDILLGQKIGNGNFGDVFKGTYKPTNQEVAVKTCRETLSEDAKKKFLQEGRILKQYEHPNIVKFIGIAAHRHPVMIVMEYVPGGSLLNFLKKQGKQQSKTQLIKMCQGAAAGMAYLESRSCIHRDLAARNCLVGKKNIVKISDFGMSREEEEYTVSGGLKQIPIKWTAPEALNYGTYTSACDVWSFGVLMWEVFSFGQSPYPGLTNSQAREKVDDGYRMPRPDYMPEAVYSLTMKCWFQEPKERPHFSEIDAELQKILQSM